MIIFEVFITNQSLMLCFFYRSAFKGMTKEKTCIENLGYNSKDQILLFWIICPYVAAL